MEIRKVTSLVTDSGRAGRRIQVGGDCIRIDEISRNGDMAPITCYLVTYADGSTLEVNGRNANEIRREALRLKQKKPYAGRGSDA